MTGKKSNDEDRVLQDLPDKLYFRIGEVASVVGVEPHVLRYWEGEFSLEPHRSSSGQRLYRKADIEQFLRIRHLLHERGYTVVGARKVLGRRPDMDPGISPDAILDARQRLRNARESIRALRDDLEKMGA